MTAMQRRGALAALGLAAVGFLLAMTLSGRSRPTQSLVAFEAAGLMREAPERIDRVELDARGRHATLTRASPGRWVVAAGPVSKDVAASIAAHLEMSLKFMHVAAPVRSMERGEFEPSALGEYGLDPPRYRIALHAGGPAVLAASFGARNPQEVFQYVRVDGRDLLYLLPVFVGKEWEQVIDGLTPS